MFITICIPTYNRAYILERAINSVISQSESDWELLIIDDGSTDNTYDIVLKYLIYKNIHYVKKENGGKHSALNVGVKRAEGEYFLILDSDDYLSKDCIRKMKEILNIYNQDDVCGVVGKCVNISKNSSYIGDLFDKEGDKISYIEMHFGGKKRYGDCCECIKTKILKKYEWCEIPGLKFVPESYVLDKIGIQYYLVCTNSVLEFFEYLDDGITKNVSDFQLKNNLGFLINYVDKLDFIFKKVRIPIKKKISIWFLYWNSVKIDKRYNNNKGPRVKNVTGLGVLVKIFMPFINIFRAIAFRKFAE